MGKSPSDSLLAAAVRGEPDHTFDAVLTRCIAPDHCDALMPQSLIDLMPTADEYIARLESLAREFIGPDPVLTCTTLDWWIDRVVAHLCTRDTHAAHLTIQ